MYRSIKPHGYLDNRASARHHGRNRGREEKVLPRHRTNGRSRLSILEAKRRQRLVDAPLLERVAGENMRQLEIKAGSARKITGSPAVPSCSERGEVVESFRFVFLLVFSLSLSLYSDRYARP